jgi:DNA polymerase I-like protein with 3'-5' exonuclease and polymerase domains
MRIIKTQDLSPDTMPTTETEKLWIYNGLDCCITYEILDKLLPQLRPETRATYDFSRSLQGVILEMNTRGLRVDEERRQTLLRQYRTETVQLSEQLNRIIREGVGFQFEISPNRKHDWPSDQQLCKLFYDYMGIPAIFKLTDEGERRLTVDRKALEKLEGYFYAEPIVRHLYVLREHGKKISFLNSAIDGDGRLRTISILQALQQGDLHLHFQISGQEPTYKMSKIVSDPSSSPTPDTNSATSTSNNPTPESAEQSTGISFVTRATWICASQVICILAFLVLLSLHWNGPTTLQWIDDLLIPVFIVSLVTATLQSVLGHGTNYQGEPPKMARETHIPVGDIERFQRAYLPNFAFERWWEWVADQVKSSGVITTMLGRRRKFFGHPKDPDTIRAAIAYEPQSVTADTINRGMLAVWLGNRVQLLLQVHDSILFQFPEEQEDEIVPWALGLVQQRMVLKGGREFMIPAEAKVGWNWSDDRNDPDALRKWPEKERRTRVRG